MASMGQQVNKKKQKTSLKGKLYKMNMNEVKVAGNLTRNVELKTAANGLPFATGTIAINNTRKTDDVTYVDFTVFGKTAENLVNITQRGNNVMLEGRLSVRNYETKDGQKRKSTEVIANTFQAITRKPKADAVASEPMLEELPL